MGLLTTEQQTELQDLIQNMVTSACKRAVITTHRLTPQQAIEYIGVISSYNSLKKLVSQGLKKHQLNGKTYYLRNEIDEFIKNNDIPSNLD
ncbi:helix-turn-helix domain-containing protein [Periweissella fabaria]|uniref:Helix-turn-helix domain-containing protein n=1 Tax=Periweissella fabaria TaxID=546157 RepID=A0ABM8Z715_9LACO|nr:hypothetical protein [Periweissella fabaria]MCM0597724.1 helix-turn-helix domain-containing protein [Periweissella fabaria]CAH0417173.1 hypothetical protein WFA24289_01502 [Periweissella fabaria]